MAIYKVVQHWQATFIHGNLRTLHIGIGMGLRQGTTAGQATLIHENLHSVLALATNSYLWQMTKCFSISSPHLSAVTHKVHQHQQKNIWWNTLCICTFYRKKTKGLDTGLGTGTSISVSMSVDLCNRLLQ